jgi:hypothetical protein
MSEAELPELPEHPGARQALVLGLVALGCAVTSCACLPILGTLVFGPLAWRRGQTAAREIAAEPGRYGNVSQAVTAMWLGALSTVLGVVLVVAIVVFLAFVTL